MPRGSLIGHRVDGRRAPRVETRRSHARHTHHDRTNHTTTQTRPASGILYRPECRPLRSRPFGRARCYSSVVRYGRGRGCCPLLSHKHHRPTDRRQTRKPPNDPTSVSQSTAASYTVCSFRRICAARPHEREVYPRTMLDSARTDRSRQTYQIGPTYATTGQSGSTTGPGHRAVGLVRCGTGPVPSPGGTYR